MLTLDHDDVRELERIRAARDVGPIGAVPAGLPELGNVLGGGKTGRNDPCPCGSGKKFKRCHGGMKPAARRSRVRPLRVACAGRRTPTV